MVKQAQPEQVDPDTGEITDDFAGLDYTPPADLKVPHVIFALALITESFSEVGIGKNRRNETQRYNFRGVEDAMNALSSEISRARLVLTPRFKRVIERSVHTSAKGGLMFSTVIEMDYEFTSSIDGSTHTCTVPGEGADYSDKSVNKALSSAYKYMAFQQFSIPTEGLMADSDQDHPQAQAPRSDPPAGSGQQARPPSNTKSSAQAKKDGDWEYLHGSLEVQVSEEGLEAWARAHSSHIKSLPGQWKSALREAYAKKLEEVRKAAWEEMEREKSGAPGPDCPF